MLKMLCGAAIGLALAAGAASAAEAISVVAAENFYGEVARTIGGERVVVTDVLTNPNVDPHDFEPSPSVARAVADARVVLFNGADYDPWMSHLLTAAERPERVAIEAAALVGVREGGNPHVWYDPKTIPAVADALATALAKIDPDGAAGYQSRRDAYITSLDPLKSKVAAIRERHAGAPVTATEPVFGYMADALGLVMSNSDFQTAIMNETEPSASAIAGILDDLRNNRVRALIYNNQVTDAMTEQLLTAAKVARVPVVGVSETLPTGLNYEAWMLGQLDALDKALAGPNS
jgi:zinc/manganese transport system substrate-binding protein